MRCTVCARDSCSLPLETNKCACKALQELDAYLHAPYMRAQPQSVHRSSHGPNTPPVWRCRCTAAPPWWWGWGCSSTPAAPIAPAVTCWRAWPVPIPAQHSRCTPQHQR